MRERERLQAACIQINSLVVVAFAFLEDGRERKRDETRDKAKHSDGYDARINRVPRIDVAIDVLVDVARAICNHYSVDDCLDDH